MKPTRLLAILIVLVVPFMGMAETVVDSTEISDSIQTDSLISDTIINAHYLIRDSKISHERDTDNFHFNDNDFIEDYIYINEYEEEKNIIDRVITRLLKTSVDTNYITTNDYGLRVNLSQTVYGGHTFFSWETNSDTIPDHCVISSDKIIKPGIWLGYRNFGWGFSYDFKNLGKNKNYYNAEYSFSYYGDKWGASVSANIIKSNNIKFNKIHTDLRNEDVFLTRAQLGAYYVLFNRKFSYNAAFSHSMRQEKSAGSPIFGFLTNGIHMEANTEKFPKFYSGDEEIKIPSRITYSGFSLSAGYAHNFVTKKKTLFHISLIPDMTIMRQTSIAPQPEELVKYDTEAQFGAVAKTSWIWQREHHLISIFCTTNWHNIIDDPIFLSDLYYTVGICYGFRAYKHERPHKKKRVRRRDAMLRGYK